MAKLVGNKIFATFPLKSINFNPMNTDLTGKRAVVCGSTQGIGKAAAMELAQSGAVVTLVARDESKLKTVLSELPAGKARPHDYLVADFSKPDQLEQKITDFVNDLHEPVHILVNNTGGPPGGPIIEASVEEFRIAFDMHLVCNHIMVQALLDGMQEANYGRIINIISTSVKIPLKGLGVSNTVRGAVANWSKTMANELGQYNITVNNILPGATKTARLDNIIQNKMQKLGKSEQEVIDQMQGTIPLGRFGKPEELANAIAFLASPAAAYISGVSLPVDGGRTGSL